MKQFTTFILGTLFVVTLLSGSSIGCSTGNKGGPGQGEAIEKQGPAKDDGGGNKDELQAQFTGLLVALFLSGSVNKTLAGGNVGCKGSDGGVPPKDGGVISEPPKEGGGNPEQPQQPGQSGTGDGKGDDKGDAKGDGKGDDKGDGDGHPGPGAGEDKPNGNDGGVKVGKKGKYAR